MFLDESGNHTLSPSQLKSDYPIFVLGGVIAGRAYVRDTIQPQMEAFKERHFGHTGIVLHTAEMIKGSGEYAFLSDAPSRTRFYTDLQDLLRSWTYQVIACVVKKRDLVALYGADADDPYRYSLHVLIERFCAELAGSRDAGFICAERRGGSLDARLLAEWERMRAHGTSTTPADVIDSKIVSLELRDKQPGLAGMQLADLVVTPVGRYVLGAPAKDNRIPWSVVESKLCQSDGAYRGRGLIIRP